MLKGINWLAVAIAVVLLEALGFVYYGFLVVGPWTAAYTASLGRAPDMSNAAVSQSIGIVITIILVTGLGWALKRMAIAGTAAIGAALAVWLFFNFTTMAVDYVYMAMSPTLVGINMGYQLLSYLIAGAVIGLMPKKGA
jgi:hypothetical protein